MTKEEIKQELSWQIQLFLMCKHDKSDLTISRGTFNKRLKVLYYAKALEAENKTLKEEHAKQKKTIEILRDSFDLSVGIWQDFKGNIQGYYISGADENNNGAYIDITKEQYQLLKEVLETTKKQENN